MIRHGKAVVSLEHIYVDNIKPPYSYKRNKNSTQLNDVDWNKANVTIF